MRRRISLTMAALVVGALVLVGLATLGLTQLDSVHETQSELVAETEGLANGVEAELSTGRHHDLLDVLHSTVSVLKGPLEQEGEVLAVSRTGTFYNPLDPSQPAKLPSGLSAQDIWTDQFISGTQAVSGHKGRLAWAAELLPTPVPVGQGINLNVVVILAREAPSGLGAAGTWFAVTAAVTVLISLLAADRLGRRIARPLQQTEVVTRRIAAGDLGARVGLAKREGHELVSLANSVNQMAASLARAQRAQRQFLMSVSHDLRTPLTSIRGFAEALSDGTTSDVHYAAGVILSEARRLERLVGDLLELAKLEAGAFSLNCVTVDLSDVASDATQGFEPAAAHLGLSLEMTSTEAGPLFCDADPDRLAQVVTNVVENALKYASSKVTVITSARRGQPTLSVEDDGPGIAREDLDRVFERLYQSASAASRKLGSGLGLAIVQELVEAMGGNVSAESPVSSAGGTRLVVTLRPPRPAAGPSGVAAPRDERRLATPLAEADAAGPAPTAVPAEGTARSPAPD
ncbi:MAG TPA: HAMP domain-containing sensor histidine kinase [Acidimicrobiales bacterium]|nr:HAMP domain-containing sensor histidine kinase [Acidimicrobiales bacterium]